MELVEYADREMMMIALANTLAGQLGRALASHETATFAVPGGTTPGPVFDSLSDAQIDWSRVRVLLTDERWVPEDHGRSNARLVRKRLLQNHAAAAVLVPLYLPVETPEEATEALTEAVAAVLPISVLLLGMGTDGHVASLFPGADRLDEALAADAPPVLPMRAGDAGEPRMTLTAPVLRGAMATHLLITGPEKREALERVRTLPPAEAPVRVVWPDVTVHWAE